MSSRFAASVLAPITALAVLVFASEARAQGFSVSPIQIVADVPAGQDITVPITMGNSTATRLLSVTVEQVELLQRPNGTWTIAPRDSDELTEGHQSNLAWFDPFEDELTINPGQSSVIELTATVPRSLRGTAVSALLITSNEQSDADDAVRLRFQFLVPIILTASGRAARQNITLDDMTLVLRRPDAAIAPNARGRAIALAGLNNTGESYSRIAGTVRVERETDDGWRFVTNATVSERGIIPGASLALEAPLGRGLPPGRYRLAGNLTADGRFLPRRTVEIEFEGDPALTSVAYDAQTRIDPGEIELTVRRGALRAQPVEVANPGTEMLVVQFETQTPRVLAGSAMGDLVGTDLSAADWIEIRPSELRLRPDSARNIRVSARLPEDAPEQAFFFAELTANSFYQDGQPAGSITVPVTITSDPEAAAPAMVLDRLAFGPADTPDTALITIRAVNVGNVAVRPDPSVGVVSSDGQILATIDLEGPRDRMLPLTVWDYAGTLPLTDIPEGNYGLRAIVTYDGNNQVEDTAAVVVTRDNEGGLTLSGSDSP